MLGIFAEVNSKLNLFGIIGLPTSNCIYDDYERRLKVGDIVLVTHNSNKWSRLSFVCCKNDKLYIPALPHIRVEDKENFSCVKIMDSNLITDGFKLNNFCVKDTDFTILNKNNEDAIMQKRIALHKMCQNTPCDCCPIKKQKYPIKCGYSFGSYFTRVEDNDWVFPDELIEAIYEKFKEYCKE